MSFDPNHQIHMEPIREDSPFLDTITAINEEAFPVLERFPVPAMVKMAQTDFDNFQLHFEAVMDGDVAVGFCMYLEFETCTYWMFLAMDAQYRSRGYGTQVFALMGKQFRAKGKPGCFMIEALDPESANYEQRVARKRLYLRMGMVDTGKHIQTKAGSMLVMTTKPDFDPSQSAGEMKDAMAQMFRALGLPVPEMPNANAQ